VSLDGAAFFLITTTRQCDSGGLRLVVMPGIIGGGIAGVEAADAKSAIKQAFDAFSIEDKERQHRLSPQRVTD